MNKKNQKIEFFFHFFFFFWERSRISKFPLVIFFICVSEIDREKKIRRPSYSGRNGVETNLEVENFVFEIFSVKLDQMAWNLAGILNLVFSTRNWKKISLIHNFVKKNFFFKKWPKPKISIFFRNKPKTLNFLFHFLMQHD